MVCPLPQLDTHLLNTLPWYTACLTEVGLGSTDYLSVQNRQTKTVGAISCCYSLRNSADDPQQLMGYTTLCAKALNRNQTAMSELMRDTFQQARFDESERLQELITHIRTHKEQSITQNGHLLAMQVASSPCNPVSRLIHAFDGLGGLQSIKQLEQQIKEDNGRTLQNNLEQLHQQLHSAEKQWLAISEKEQMTHYLDTLSTAWQDQLQQAPQESRYRPETTTYQPITQAWITNSQVHFCARAYPSVALSHPDAAPLSVLGGVLRNGYLHRTVREQGGAYGGGATQDSRGGTFRFYSYRDPRMTETFNDFDNAIDWLINSDIDPQSIEESILGVISSLDKPNTPAGMAKKEFHAQFNGRSQKQRTAFRQGVIQVTPDDLKRVTETYLSPEKASTAVVTGIHGQEEAEKLGMEIIKGTAD